MARRLDVDDLDRETIDSARVTSPSEKLLEGLRLFDRTCAVMVAGIETDHPRAGRSEVLQILRERLLLARRLET